MRRPRIVERATIGFTLLFSFTEQFQYKRPSGAMGQKLVITNVMKTTKEQIDESADRVMANAKKLSQPLAWRIIKKVFKFCFGFLMFSIGLQSAGKNEN